MAEDVIVPQLMKQFREEKRIAEEKADENP